MDVLKTLLNLCSFESVSGKEKNLTNYLYKTLEKYSKNIKTTNLNSIICEIKGKKNCKLNIIRKTHIDSIGFVVQNITKDRKSIRCCAKKDYVLFSPACASFDLYKNFEQRGKDFIKIVQNI